MTTSTLRRIRLAVMTAGPLLLLVTTLLAQSAQNAVREWKWAKADHESTEMLEFKFKP